MNGEFDAFDVFGAFGEFDVQSSNPPPPLQIFFC